MANNKKKKKKKKVVNKSKKNRNKKKNTKKKVSKSNTYNKNVKKSVAVDKKKKDNLNNKASDKSKKDKKITKDIIVKQKEITKPKKEKRKINKAILRKVFIVLFSVLCISLIVISVKLMNDKSKSNRVDFEEISVSEYFELYKSTEIQFIYLTSDRCLDCSNYENSLDKLQKEYKINIKKLDFTNLNDNDIEKMESSNSLFDGGIDVPTILSVKNGEEISSLGGIKEYGVLKNFINNSLSPVEVNSFENITIDKYLSLLDSKNLTFIYIGASSNKGCKKFSPILEEVSVDRKLKVFYLNTDDFKTSGEWDKLKASDKIFEDIWFMPAMLIIKDGKINDYKMETLSKVDLEKFLKKNKL